MATREQHLPGLAPQKIVAIHEAAERLHDLQIDQRDAKKRTDDAKEALIRTMRGHGERAYAHGNLIVTLSQETKVKVEFTEDDGEEGEES